VAVEPSEPSAKLGDSKAPEIPVVPILR